VTAPLRHGDLTGRGHRTAQTLLALAERDRLLRAAADRYCTGMSDRAAAAMLYVKLTRYREGRFRRSRAEPTCPLQHLGRLDALLWAILRNRDHIPSERSIRRILGFRGPKALPSCDNSMEM
jgi:hypothetical protein